MPLLFAVLVALTTAVASEAPRPPPLPAKVACDVYDGTAAGNDPSVELSLRICVDDSGVVTGEAQWSSTVSGWNRRELAGKRTSTGFQLRDVRVIDGKANGGWRFCEIESWTLTLSGTSLTGHYQSAACADSATVTLSKRPVESASE